MDEIIMAAGRKKAENAIVASKVVSMFELESQRKYYRTGIPQIDNALGGIPVSCIGHVASKEGVGKSTIVCQMCISALRFLPEKMKVALCDFEGRSNKNMISKMLKYYGISSKRFLISAPIDGESGLATIEDWIFNRDDIAIVIGDSLKAVITEKSIKKKITEAAAAMGNANLVNRFLEKILNKFPNQKTSLLWIDHLKPVASSSMYKTNDTKSGDAIKFYTSWRINLAKDKKGKITKISKGQEILLGHHIKLKVIKTTVSPMVTINNIPMYYVRGIATVNYLFRDAINNDIIKKEEDGAFYYIPLKGKPILIGRTKAEKKKWTIENKNTFLSEIEKRLYEINKKIFDERMSKEFSFEESEFNF